MNCNANRNISGHSVPYWFLFSTTRFSYFPQVKRYLTKKSFVSENAVIKLGCSEGVIRYAQRTTCSSAKSGVAPKPTETRPGTSEHQHVTVASPFLKESFVIYGREEREHPKKLIFHHQFLTLPYTISLHRRKDPPEIICFKSDLPHFIVHHVMIYTTSSLQEFLCFILQLSTHLHKHWAGPSGGQSAPINQTCARPQILRLLK